VTLRLVSHAITRVWTSHASRVVLLPSRRPVRRATADAPDAPLFTTVLPYLADLVCIARPCPVTLAACGLSFAIIGPRQVTPMNLTPTGVLSNTWETNRHTLAQSRSYVQMDVRTREHEFDKSSLETRRSMTAGSRGMLAA
jgi:hypothetical protein